MSSTILVSVLAGLLGAREWRRIQRKHGSITLENALQHARHLLVVAPMALAFLMIQLLVLIHPDITWSMPVWLELHHVSLVVGAAAFCIALVFGFATYGSFATHHRRRAVVAVASLALVSRFQIGNNRGRINGWIGRTAIFGRLVSVE